MISIKIVIFILSLILFDSANGQPIRLAGVDKNDLNIELSLSNAENELSNLSWKRLKRVSDQRLAELETLYSIYKINSLTSTDRPIYIRMKPTIIKRRKRKNNENQTDSRRIVRHTNKLTYDETPR
ncbi:PREDICTED: uncharacterized protein LOC107071360 [Polistes dominula]|uniref:Uncharacterized protein LOC107071360 n=1 Tax=Polistes dominula TaxID=743375 RepID=A0ABM1J015_POLDO|nr:PREDICTED: uncharacterized protein LOC107071360 [Polistes dominula]